MRILFLGDIVGRSGRDAVISAAPELRDAGVETVELNPRQEALTPRYTKRALDFIDRNKDKPFLANMAVWGVAVVAILYFT